ncbi:MAG: hypothetical protein CME32_30575, partial [Gimesia sp.]|nr:hypothetical protein [Gimesia sp.]
MSSRNSLSNPSDEGRDKQQRRRVIEANVQSSETIEEYDHQSGRLVKRTTRSKTKDYKILENITPEQNISDAPPVVKAHPLPRITESLTPNWFRLVPGQLTVSVFDVGDDIPLELEEFAGDYILSCVSREPELVCWRYRFPAHQGLSMLTLDATP